MGSPEGEKERHSYEDQHEVTLKQGFWLADTPVTQSFWEAVTCDNPSNFKGDDLPVEKVSWNDTQSFIETVNKLHPDLSVALPYEAEWEYACRGGTNTAFNFGDEIDSTQANYRGTWEFDPEKWGEDAPKKTTAIKSYPPNDGGLYDMHGNVLEWCQDEWQEHLGKSPIVIDTAQAPEASETGQRQSEETRQHVVRGGSWNIGGGDCRSAYRDRLTPEGYSNELGFRLVSRSCKIGGAAGRG